jgi:hypothetical protein
VKIFVKKNEQTFGPFTEKETRDRIYWGQFSETDQGWLEGQSENMPLSRILFLCSTPTADKNISPFLRSHLPKASLIISMICLGGWIMSIIFLAIVSEEFRADMEKMRLLVSLMFFIFASNVVGLIFGITASTKRISNKRSAIKGIIFNGAQILIILFIIIAGQLAK